MFFFKRANVFLIALALCTPIIADQAKNYYEQGTKAEKQGNYDAAYLYYKQASAAAPQNPKYLATFTRMRFSAAAQHIHTGQLLRNTGDFKRALAEFKRAAEIDSSSVIAQQELRRTEDILNRKDQQAAAQPAPRAPKLPDELGQPVVLQPLSNAPITVYMTANADVIYRTIGKLAGLNVVFDPDYKPQKITVDLTDISLRDALDIVRLQSKSFWRPVLPNTIFVSTDSQAKRKELEQNVMKTFYLRNIEGPTDLQDAANVLKQMLDVTRIQLLQAQDALVLRGTPDQLALAEQILSDYDRPRGEVVIDVAVMEVSKDRLRTLGNAVPTAFSTAVVPPYVTAGGSNSSGSSGSGSSNSNGSWTIQSLAHVSSHDFVFSIPGSSFSILSSDSNTKLLQNPQIRALNNEKATLRIGDRVPIATGSFQPGIAGAGAVSPLIGTQFTYLDVGVNVDITPHIHSDREVTLKMSLEISSVTGEQNIGGITQPVIGQRRIEHEARLTDGEVNLIGGILEDSERQSLSGYPWISKIPILKYFFAQENKDRQQSEVVFAITPHIVRAPEDESARMIEIGTGSSIELHRTAPPSKSSEQPKASSEQPKAPQPAGQQPDQPKPQPAQQQSAVPKNQMGTAPLAQAAALPK